MKNSRVGIVNISCTCKNIDNEMQKLHNRKKSCIANVATLLTNRISSIAVIGAAKDISAACLQYTTVPRKYILSMPMARKH